MLVFADYGLIVETNLFFCTRTGSLILEEATDVLIDRLIRFKTFNDLVSEYIVFEYLVYIVYLSFDRDRDLDFDLDLLTYLLSSH
jgi:hypothetical protein